MLKKPTNPKERYKRSRQLPKAITSPEELDQAVSQAVLANLMPEAPFIDRSTIIVSIGSCFAENITASLQGSGYRIGALKLSERLFNAFSLRAFFEALLRDEDVSEFQKHWSLSEAELKALLRAIRHGSVVILTLGLSFVWVDEKTGQIVFDPTQKDGLKLISVDPARFQMKPTTVSENTEAISAVIDAIRAINPTTKIILTLSPVHMARAISDYPAVVADTISKSTLRCALHEVISQERPDVFYFPSFEILRWLVPMVDVSFGSGTDILHIHPKWVDYTVSKFRQYYCIGETAIAPPFTPRQLPPFD